MKLVKVGAFIVIEGSIKVKYIDMTGFEFRLYALSIQEISAIESENISTMKDDIDEETLWPAGDNKPVEICRYEEALQIEGAGDERKKYPRIYAAFEELKTLLSVASPCLIKIKRIR